MKAHAILDEPDTAADPVDCWVNDVAALYLGQSRTRDDREGFPIEEHVEIALTLAQAEQLQADLPELIGDMKRRLEQLQAELGQE